MINGPLLLVRWHTRRTRQLGGIRQVTPLHFQMRHAGLKRFFFGWTPPLHGREPLYRFLLSSRTSSVPFLLKPDGAVLKMKFLNLKGNQVRQRFGQIFARLLNRRLLFTSWAVLETFLGCFSGFFDEDSGAAD